MLDNFIRWAFIACAVPSVVGVVYFLRLAERKRRVSPGGFDIIRHSLRRLEKMDDHFLDQDPIAKNLLVRGTIWIAIGFALFIGVFLVGVFFAIASVIRSL